MGKSASGAVCLNAERLLPYDFWQFWQNSEDTDVVPASITARRDRTA
jgi:tyrosyl-tRNA synthetase